MKTTTLKLAIIFLILATGLTSCKEKEPKELDPGQIAANLAKNGSIDPAHLVGEWAAVKFAYTPDGKKISNHIDIPVDYLFYDIEWIAEQQGISVEEAIDRARPLLKIPDPPHTPPKEEWYYWDEEREGWLHKVVLWNLLVCNSSWWICSISSHLINIDQYESTLMGCPGSTEGNVGTALWCAYSFVVRGDEFMIFFTIPDHITLLPSQSILENRNLLILKRRK
jgi:hypothetical protein